MRRRISAFETISRSQSSGQLSNTVCAISPAESEGLNRNSFVLPLTSINRRFILSAGIVLDIFGVAVVFLMLLGVEWLVDVVVVVVVVVTPPQPPAVIIDVAAITVVGCKGGGVVGEGVSTDVEDIFLVSFNSGISKANIIKYFLSSFLTLNPFYFFQQANDKQKKQKTLFHYFSKILIYKKKKKTRQNIWQIRFHKKKQL